MVEIEVGGVKLDGFNIARSATHGLVGFAAPALIVLVSYPVLIRHLGPAAFGRGAQSTPAFGLTPV